MAELSCWKDANKVGGECGGSGLMSRARECRNLELRAVSPGYVPLAWKDGVAAPSTTAKHGSGVKVVSDRCPPFPSRGKLRQLRYLLQKAQHPRLHRCYLGSTDSVNLDGHWLGGWGRLKRGREAARNHTCEFACRACGKLLMTQMKPSTLGFASSADILACMSG